MTERETAVAAPFRHRNADHLRQVDLIFYYTQDKKWMSLDKAKKLISIAEKKRTYQKREHGGLLAS